MLSTKIVTLVFGFPFILFSVACTAQAPEPTQIPVKVTTLVVTATPLPPTNTPVPSATPTPSPTDTPQPTVDIEATVEVRVSATLAAQPTPTNTLVPTLTPLPTNTPRPLPTATSRPTPRPTATPIPPSPTYTPEPVVTVTDTGQVRRLICARDWKGGLACGAVRLPDLGRWQIDSGENFVSTWIASRTSDVDLVIRCRDSETDAFLFFGRFIGFSDPEITYQIDVEQPIKLVWNWSNTREAAFFPGDVTQFVMDLIDGESLVMHRAPLDENDTATNARFELAGLSSSIASVRHECEW